MHPAVGTKPLIYVGSPLIALALSLWTSLVLAAATVLLVLRNALHRRSRLS